MVMFTCNHCGQAVKKNQVDVHCNTRCRNCQSLSCMDCGKEFWGNDYQEHTKCLTENEKYGGKNFKAKPSSNKGEIIQEMWIEHVKNTIATKNIVGPLKGVLQQAISFPNIPRKKTKFENFLFSSLNIRNKDLINKAWDIFSQSPSWKPEKNIPVSNGSSNPDTNKSKETGVSQTTENPSKKYRKRTRDDADINGGRPKKICMESSQDEIPDDEKRFELGDAIKRILTEHPGNEMPLSRLRKKVFAEYMTFEGSSSGLSKKEVKAKLKALLQNDQSFVILKGN